MSDLVRDSEVWFSHIAAHIAKLYSFIIGFICSKIVISNPHDVGSFI